MVISLYSAKAIINKARSRIGKDIADLLTAILDSNVVYNTKRRLIAAGSTLAMIAATHDGKIILLDTAAGSTVTLPQATGSGAVYRFQISNKATSNNHKVQVANSTDIIQGTLMGVSDDPATVKGWIAGAADDTITLNRTTTGSVTVGEFIEIRDIAAGVFAVFGFIAQTGTEATPFSSAV